jgi:hypothetical protein
MRKGIWLPMCGSDLTHGRVTTLQSAQQTMKKKDGGSIEGSVNEGRMKGGEG